MEKERYAGLAGTEQSGSLQAPVPGEGVIEVVPSVGERVEKGQVLVGTEAMKMEHRLRAPRPGEVGSVRSAPGEQVERGKVPVVTEEKGDSSE